MQDMLLKILDLYWKNKTTENIVNCEWCSSNYIFYKEIQPLYSLVSVCWHCEALAPCEFRYGTWERWV